MLRSHHAIMRVAFLFMMAVSALTLVSSVAAICKPPGDFGTPGNDTIECNQGHEPVGDVGGDLGDDEIEINSSTTVNYVTGDGFDPNQDNIIDQPTGEGGNDTIHLKGHANAFVAGDYVFGNGGNDTITIDGTVSAPVYGDLAIAAGETTVNGGHDTILVNGAVNSHVSGDFVGNGNGGDDTIIVNGSVDCVQGDELTSGNGGNDTITINGTAGCVTGDTIYNSGNGGNDTITIRGTVGEVQGDNIQQSSLGGSDRIIISGTVTTSVFGDSGTSGLGGDDYVELQNGASIGGTIEGREGTDILAFAFSGIGQPERDTLAAAIAAASPAGGSLTIRGQTYTWVDFEQLLNLS